ISKYRPQAPIVAVTFSDTISRQLSLAWGVYSIAGKEANSADEMLDIAIDCGLSTTLFQRGSKVIITAGVPVGERGTTNLKNVHIIGDVVGKGQGIGKNMEYGKGVQVKKVQEANEKVNENDIIITYGTDKEMMPALEKAGAIVTVEGGLTSHAAVVGLSLGIPVIVGVEDVFDLIKDGQDITVDGAKGDIYHGHAHVL